MRLESRAAAKSLGSVVSTICDIFGNLIRGDEITPRPPTAINGGARIA
jgi:hypothetical protein